MVRVKMWGKSSQNLIVILNLGKPYGLKDQIYWDVFLIARGVARFTQGVDRLSLLVIINLDKWWGLEKSTESGL